MVALWAAIVRSGDCRIAKTIARASGRFRAARHRSEADRTPTDGSEIPGGAVVALNGRRAAGRMA